MRRRSLVTSASAAVLAGALPRALTAADLAARLRALEARSGGRLGVFARRAGDGRAVAHRAGERFLLCSTFKILAVAAVLRRVDAGRESLDRRVRYGSADLLAYAPVTRSNVAAGSMRLGDLCAAAIELSDNTAANLIVASLGGPAAVTAFARGIGDETTILAHTGPALNVVAGSTIGDTTTPAAIARDLERLVLGSALAASSRAQLTGWMRACRTGATRIRAGVPRRWAVADKTGTGGGTNGTGASDTRNDIAVLWPDRGGAVVVAVYLTDATSAEREGDAVIAAAARTVSSYLAAPAAA